MIAALLLAVCAAAAEPRLTSLPGLWAAAALPAGWEEVSPDSWEPRGAKGATGLTLRFISGEQPGPWLKAKAEPGAAAAANGRRPRASPRVKRGPWTLLQISEPDSGGTLKTLYAARQAPGGLYAAAYFGGEPAFSRGKPQFLALLDSFRRRPPPLRYAQVGSPDGFSVAAPTAPWIVSLSDVDAAMQIVAPKGPGAEPPGLLELRVLGADAKAGARFLADLCAGGPTVTRRAKAGVFRVAEGTSQFGARPMAERVSGRPRLLRSKCAAVEAGGRAYGVSWSAPPASYDEGLPAFDKALETLTFLDFGAK